MAGMNSQIHLTIETEILNALRLEAEKMEISVAELIRRKLSNPATEKEVIELRKFKEILRQKRKGASS